MFLTPRPPFNNSVFTALPQLTPNVRHAFWPRVPEGSVAHQHDGLGPESDGGLWEGGGSAVMCDVM